MVAFAPEPSPVESEIMGVEYSVRRTVVEGHSCPPFFPDNTMLCHRFMLPTEIPPSGASYSRSAEIGRWAEDR